MRVGSEPERGPWTPGLGRRLVAGLAAVAAAAVSALLSTLAMFVLLLTPLDCSGPDRWQQFAEGSIVAAFVTAVAALGWALTLSLLRLCWGRPGLRKRSWFGAQGVGLVITLVAIGITVATVPDPDPAQAPSDCGLSALH